MPRGCSTGGCARTRLDECVRDRGEYVHVRFGADILSATLPNTFIKPSAYTACYGPAIHPQREIERPPLRDDDAARLESRADVECWATARA
jgi:hypothetical protein